MKKILLLLSLLVAFFVSNAQYPVVQFLGRDSALVDSRGGLKARLINYAFTDTTEANTQRVNKYPGALIYTTLGGDNLWLRNSSATAWGLIGSGGGSVDLSGIRDTLGKKVDTTAVVKIDTTGKATGKIPKWDATYGGFKMANDSVGSGGSGSFSVLKWRTGDVNAPAAGDSLIIHHSFIGKYSEMYRGSNYGYFLESVVGDTGFTRVNDTTYKVKPPFAADEWYYMRLTDSSALTQLTLQAPSTPPSTTIAYVNSQAYTGTSATSYTFSFTVSSGSNRILIVSFEGATGSGADDITSVTYNGVAMTLGQKTAPTNGTNRYLYTYYLLNPSSGANNVVISRTTSDWMLPVAAEYTGVQSVESSVTYTCACSNATVNYSTVQDNTWLVTAVSSTGTTITSISGLTKRVASNGTYATLFDSGALTPAGSKSYSTTGIPGGQGHAGLVLKHY